MLLIIQIAVAIALAPIILQFLAHFFEIAFSSVPAFIFSVFGLLCFLCLIAIIF